MTPEAQRIAIAEACGWKLQVNNLWKNKDGKLFLTCLNYLSDLNAMHEAEKVLQWEQRKQYHNILADVAGFSYCEADSSEETELDWNCRICHATVAQRAEAFLRTLNLYIP